MGIIISIVLKYLLFLLDPIFTLPFFWLHLTVGRLWFHTHDCQGNKKYIDIELILSGFCWGWRAATTGW